MLFAQSAPILSRIAPRLRIGLLMLCALSLPAAGQPLSAVVSIPPQKFFVEQIGGQHVTVMVMVGPGQNPAIYSPTPRQIGSLAGADLYFTIGVGFEDNWLGRIRATNPALRIVDTRNGIELREMQRLDSHRPTHRHGRHPLRDPHVWTNPLLVKIMATHIRDALIRLDPAHQEAYRRNHAHFAQQLTQLDGEIRAIIEPLPKRRFMVFHPSWGYFADRYGLQQLPIEVEGKNPGARTLSRLIDQARAEGIDVIFVQRQFSRRTAETVAQAIGARVIAVDPLAEDYIENLRQVAKAFGEAMNSQ